jgi:hypothetical protein
MAGGRLGGAGDPGGLGDLGGAEIAGGAAGAWAEGENQAAGAGMGGPGRGRGGEAPLGDEDGIRWTDRRIRGKVNPGEVLASVRVKGLPKGGEAAAKYTEVYTEYRRQAESSLARETIPLGYRERVRDYFDKIEIREE